MKLNRTCIIISIRYKQYGMISSMVIQISWSQKRVKSVTFWLTDLDYVIKYLQSQGSERRG